MRENYKFESKKDSPDINAILFGKTKKEGGKYRNKSI